MKYVRAREGIYEKSQLIYGFNDNEEYLLQNIIKEADTIQELCDTFIVINKDGTRDLYKKIDFTTINLFKEQVYIKEIYGAIYVDYGIKKVAVMNQEGELELL